MKGRRPLSLLLTLSALLTACAPSAVTTTAVPTGAAAQSELQKVQRQNRLAYVKALAWGSVSGYEAAYADQQGVSALYPGLDWSRDGCSAPPGFDLGYSELFRPACNIHDFGYRNLKVLERTPENRETTDHAFYASMSAICQTLPWLRRAECYAAAFIYESGVRLGGTSHF